MGRGTTPFWVRSVRRRPAAAVVLALLAVVTTIASLVAPLLLRAVEQAALDDAVLRGGVAGTSVAASAPIPFRQLSSAEGAVVAATSAVSERRLWDVGIVVAESKAPVRIAGVDAGAGAASESASVDRLPKLAGLSDDCRTLGLVDGRCPSGSDEVLAAAGSGQATGTTLRLTVLAEPEQTVSVRVVGTYDPTSRAGQVVRGPGQRFGGGGVAAADFVMSLAGFDALTLDGTMWSVRTLAPGLALDDLPAALEDVAAVRDSALSASGAGSSVSVRERITDLVDGVADGNDAAALIVAVTAVQIIVLAWFAQGVVAGRIGHARAAEWGLARLRGLPPGRRAVAILAEPVIATVTGTLVGAALGLGVATVCAPLLLGPGAPPLEPLRLPVLAALGASALGSLVALVVASVRASRVPLVDLLRRATEPRTLSRAGAVVQAVAVVAAVVGLAAVVTETDVTGPSIALLAPSLIAVLLAVVALRVGVVIVRRRAARTARSLTELLVVRRIARTPSVLTSAVMVVLGVALAVSSVQTAALASRLADDRAAAATGADTVLEVDVPDGTSFVGAVRRADPTGRSAMAVETSTSGTGVGRLIAVDTTRLAAVSSWDPAWGGRSPARLVEQLRPRTGASLRITGDRLSVTLAEVGAPDGTAAQTVETATAEQVDVVAVVQSADGWHRVDLGGPRNGTLTSTTGSVPCSDGCRLVWLGLEPRLTNSAPYGLGATITGISVGDGASERTVGRAWLAPERWRNRIGGNSLPEGGPTATLGEQRTGLRVSWVDPTGTGNPSIAPRDAAEPLPALVGAATTVVPFAGIPDATAGLGLDGGSVILRVVGRAAALPRVLADGAMVDLGTAGLVTDPAASVADHEVWVAPGAGDRVATALTEQGLRVTGRHSLADAEHRAERAAPVLGAQVGLPAAATALVVVLLAVGGVAAVGARARRQDLGVLRTAGFTHRDIRRAVLSEVLLPTAAASVLGAVTGTAATVLTAAKLPLRAAVVPPMGPPVGPLVVTTITVGVLAAVTAMSVVVAASSTGRAGGAEGASDGSAA